jgi:hypothetical protein
VYQAVTLDNLPKDLDERARFYRLHTEFKELENSFRHRLGLPPAPSGGARRRAMMGLPPLD